MIRSWWRFAYTLASTVVVACPDQGAGKGPEVYHHTNQTRFDYPNQSFV